MITKKDLESQFNIGYKTVIRTLDCCGLDSGKSDYAQEEIEQIFAVARQMIDSGKTYREVAEHFGVAQEENSNPQAEQNVDNEAIAQGINIAVAEMASEMVASAVKQISPYIPSLVAHSLAQEMRSPEIQQAFKKVSENLASNTAENNSGTDFLLQKMQAAPVNLKQLTGLSDEE